MDKYEFLTGEEILPPQKHRIIEQAKFNYSRKKVSGFTNFFLPHDFEKNEKSNSELIFGMKY